MQMNPSKSPGPDGMTTGFFQGSWDVVGEDIFMAISDFFSTRILPTETNYTHIVLIPKTKKPTKMQLRPISLCNVCYKILAKLLANRVIDLNTPYLMLLVKTKVLLLQEELLMIMCYWHMR